MSWADRRPMRVGVAGVGAFGLLHARTLAGLAEAATVAALLCMILPVYPRRGLARSEHGSDTAGQGG